MFIYIVCVQLIQTFLFALVTSIAGQIQLNADISDTTVTGYDVTVSATDTEGNSGVDKTLTVIITGEYILVNNIQSS